MSAMSPERKRMSAMSPERKRITSFLEQMFEKREANPRLKLGL
jgi:hypothetical protein